MTDEAEIFGPHPQELSEIVPVRIVAGRTRDFAVGERQSLHISFRNDIDLVFGGGLPVRMTIQAQAGERFLEAVP